MGDLVHPTTGELLAITQLPEQDLAQLALNAKTLAARLKDFRADLDRELRHRLDLHDRAQLDAGPYRITAGTTKTSEWDEDELELVLRDLVDTGTVRAGELTGIITHRIEVSRRDADRLAKQLDGQARAQVEACRTWVQKPRPVTVELLP